MIKKSTHTITLALILSLFVSQAAFSRAAFDVEEQKDLNGSIATVDDPAYCMVAHRVGKISLSVGNIGTLGNGWTAGNSNTDCITGAQLPSCEYPIESNVEYLFAAAFWIGAVIGRDTLVSTGADGWSRDANEFAPDQSPFGDLIYRSLRSPEDPDVYTNAISEEDYICTYSDTLPDPEMDWDGRAHRPLNIDVTQRSYAWSYEYAEDFILFDYEIRNIGNAPIEGVYMGFYNDSDVGFTGVADYHTDDICGFRETFVSTYEDVCDFVDTVNLAWIADNDGDPDGGGYTDNSCPGVTAMRIIRTPANNLNVSFNWWISNTTSSRDFGPRERSGVGVWPEDFRDFGTGGMGTPEGDRNKYYVLRNQEFDFDQIYTADISINDPFWAYPPQLDAGTIADGFDTRYLLSFGPFDIDPGERLPISFAFIAGENFHQNPTNVDFLPDNPDQYYSNLNFSDLALNSTWASRVYDNPGVDSNGDSIYGKTRTCCFDEEETICDEIWYEGDGHPDFRGASPPPPPIVWLEPQVGSVRIRFNGTSSETQEDVFSRLRDFEGYRIYIGRDARETSFSMLASYDIDDYNKFVFNTNRVPDPGYELREVPLTLDSLKVLYGEEFNPLVYTEENPFRMIGFPDSIFYFTRQDYNASELGISTPITKVYPNQPYPSDLIPELADPSELTEEGLFKYFEYEYTANDLLPTVEWYINVTSFDFGSPESGLTSLESSKSGGSQATYPLPAINQIETEDMKVFVYPNPYRGDGGYREDGFEGRLDTDRPDDRIRAIHFANLPAKCTIRIYTLDGDLVRELEHDVDPSNPQASHHEWDLITRNTQKVVSGLYYWTVEDSDSNETQVGKLVIIM